MSDQGLGDIELGKDENNLITEKAQLGGMPRLLDFNRLQSRPGLLLAIFLDEEMRTKLDWLQQRNAVKNFHN
ncbi:hypothetical protein [Synechococcus sp. MIT S9504]|uniref:hypothetical protein n=1 Tax=Synechococcus sp. MIT S9504 TaxID=1801628 RepID=UPI0012E7411E|nr:hypothetical protein [Synechococcus sp. MIT S9504]